VKLHLKYESMECSIRAVKRVWHGISDKFGRYDWHVCRALVYNLDSMHSAYSNKSFKEASL